MSDPNVSQKPWEVKLHAFRRTQDGVVVSFVIHPAEVPRALALDDLGTRYGMALARMDEEQAPDAPHKPAIVSASDKPRRRIRNMPRSQQAAIMCQDEGFQRWLATTENIDPETATKDTADMLRHDLKIKSRAELDGDYSVPGAAWDRLYTQFQKDAGRMAEMRG